MFDYLQAVEFMIDKVQKGCGDMEEWSQLRLLHVQGKDVQELLYVNRATLQTVFDKYLVPRGSQPEG